MEDELPVHDIVYSLYRQVLPIPWYDLLNAAKEWSHLSHVKCVTTILNGHRVIIFITCVPMPSDPNLAYR